jgi:hypothetical protein
MIFEIGPVQDNGLLGERVGGRNRLSLKESETGPHQLELKWRNSCATESLYRLVCRLSKK